MNAVFADTFFYLASLNPKDEAHQQAVSFAQGYDGKIITTEFVFLEVADGLCKTHLRGRIHRFFDRLRMSSKHLIVPVRHDLFVKGLELYASRPDKEWSLTDCTSFIVMQDHGITDALTGDHHFEQAGFRVLL